MPNPHRGEVALDAGERSLTLRFDINALCELEGAVGEPAQVFLAKVQKVGQTGLTQLRAIVWAGLRYYHPELSMRDAGDVIDEAGPRASYAAFVAAINAAFPDEVKTEKRPRKAAALNR